MNVVTMMALFEELEKISSTEKSAGFMKDIGTRITANVKATPSFLQQNAQGSIRNAGNSIAAFANPVQSFKTGLKSMGSDFKKSNLPIKALMAHGILTGGRDALAKKDPTGAGRGRGERIGEFLGDQAGSIIGAPHGLTGGLVAGTIGKKIGRTAGKAVDSLRKGRQDSLRNQPTAAMPQIDM